MIIGITGRIASGKTDVAEFLKERGFKYVTISQVVREEVSSRGIEITRKTLQDIGNEIRKKEGAEGWIKRLLKRINIEEDNIIDGIRNPGEIEELRKIPNFILISVNAPKEERFKRVISRDKPSDPKTWEGFLGIDKRDFGEEDPLGQQVGKCMELADFHLMNDSTLEDFHKKIESLYKDLKNKTETE